MRTVNVTIGQLVSAYPNQIPVWKSGTHYRRSSVVATTGVMEPCVGSATGSW